MTNVAMSTGFYDIALPGVVQTLTGLDGILDKAAAFCAAKNIDPTVLINYRLAPDMFPLARQIQIMTDQAKGMAARLAGIEIPSFPDTESSIPELKARIAKTLQFIADAPKAKIDGAADAKIELKVAGADMTFTGRDYVVRFVLPNFYFHAATAYNLLRHAGVEIGKRDFLARP
jgi:hypothetical protein